MITFNIIGCLVNSVTSLFLALLIYYKNPNNNINKRYAIFGLNVSFWSIAYLFWHFSKNESQGLFFVQLLLVGAMCIPVTFMHFVIEFLGLSKQKKYTACLYSAYFISLFFIFIVFSKYHGYIIKEVSQKLEFKYWPTPEFLFNPFFIYFVVVLLYSDALLYLHMVKSDNRMTRKNQIKYILLGTFIGSIGGFTNYFLYYNIMVPPLGNILVSAYVAGIAYAIIKHRLMDITLVWRQVLIFAGYLFAVGAVSVLVFVLSYNYPMISAGMVFFLLLTAPFSYRFLQRFSQPFVDKIVLRGKYNYWDGLDKLGELEWGYFPDQISWNLVDSVSDTMQIEQASFFMLVDSHKEFRPQAQIGLDDEIGCEPICWVTLKPEDLIVKHLSKNKKPLIKDELEEPDPLSQKMQRLLAEVSIPLFVQEQLIGILNLGPKLNDEIYHQEDIKKLLNLCHQAESHLSHAMFMEKRATFSRELAHDMKNLLFKAIEPTLEELIDTKDDKKRQEILETLFNQHQYLKACLKDNFDLVSMVEKLVYHKYTLEPAQIAQVISDCALLYKDSLAKAGVGIELDIPDGLPLVLVNEEDIPKVFNNLFDNALKFTSRGGRITIKAEQKPDEVLVIFSDTGRGIDEEDLKTLFEPKVKMPDAQEPGTGLGLIIVKDIIEAHKGRIWVESAKGSGATFYFTFSTPKEKWKK